jgi:hypothetical protein
MHNRFNFQPVTVLFTGLLLLSAIAAPPTQATESAKRPSSIKYQILIQSGTTVPGSDRPPSVVKTLLSSGPLPLSRR